MDIRIQALHFDVSEALETFIHKKLDKLTRFADDAYRAEVILKVTKPEVKHNKEASIKLYTKGQEFFADKVADTFEEAVDIVIDALKRQIEKHKEQH